MLDPLRIQNWVANGMEWALMFLPLALYLLAFGLFINRRGRPVPMRGDRNIMWLLFAASGFFLIGPPSWLVQPFRSWGDKGYWIAYAVYVIVLLWAGLTWMRRERRTLIVFNLDPARLVELLPAVLAEISVPYVVTPGRVSFAEGKLVLDLETSFLFHTVSLRWQGDERDLQAKIEEGIRKVLATIESPEHPGALVLAFAGVLLFSFVVFASVLYGVLLVTLHLKSF